MQRKMERPRLASSVVEDKNQVERSLVLSYLLI